MSTRRTRKGAVKKSPQAPNPFHKAPRLPDRMKGSADLWLELFQEFTALLIPEGAQLPQALASLDNARIVTDRALEIFETRWPGADL